MPDTAKHSEQEQRDDDVYRRVFRQDNPTYSDWALTALFHRAVHTVDSFLASQSSPIYPDSHHQRTHALARLNKKRAASYCQMLRVLSEQAMHGGVTFSESELDRYEQVATVDLPSALD